MSSGGSAPSRGYREDTARGGNAYHGHTSKIKSSYKKSYVPKRRIQREILAAGVPEAPWEHFCRLKFADEIDPQQVMESCLVLLFPEKPADMKFSHCARAIKALGQIGYWKSAKMGLFTVIVQQQQQEGAAEEAGLPHVMVFNAALEAMSSAGEWFLADQLLRQMIDEYHMKPSVASYNCVLTGCAAVGEAGKALELLEEMKGYEPAVLKPNAQTFIACMRACNRAGRIQDTARLFLEMGPACSSGGGGGKNKRELESGEGTCGEESEGEVSTKKGGEQGQEVKKDLTCYNSLISACAQRGHWQQATALLRELRTLSKGGGRKDLAPDIAGYATVLSACDKADRYQECLSILSMMRREKFHFFDPKNRNNILKTGMAPGMLSCFFTAIACCERNKQFKDAESLFKEMTGKLGLLDLKGDRNRFALSSGRGSGRPVPSSSGSALGNIDESFEDGSTIKFQSTAPAATSTFDPSLATTIDLHDLSVPMARVAVRYSYSFTNTEVFLPSFVVCSPSHWSRMISFPDTTT